MTTKNKTMSKVINKKSPVKKVITHRYLRIFSRHPSTEALRKSVLVKGPAVIYRHGSTTQGSLQREINSVQAVKTSADKLLMKQAFDKAGICHAPWIHMRFVTENKEKFKQFLDEVGFPKKPLIIKHRFGSRGAGNYLIKDQANLDTFIKQRKEGLNNYIVEEYKPYTREYRLHVTEAGCFYTCRKVLKNNTPEKERFQRHDDNCSWLIETNPKFDKPAFWEKIVHDCISALKQIGADVLAFDIKCTSPKKTKEDKAAWIIIESCSAPSLGKITTEKYKIELPKIVSQKYGI